MDEETPEQTTTDKALDPELQKNRRILWKFLPPIRKRQVNDRYEVCCDGVDRWVEIRELGNADFTYLLALAKANYWRREAELKRMRERD